jgi:hypothetical protein
VDSVHRFLQVGRKSRGYFFKMDELSPFEMAHRLRLEAYFKNLVAGHEFINTKNVLTKKDRHQRS